MHYQPFRRGSIGTKGNELEEAALQVDPYLFVDVSFEKPGQLQLWRKHPSGHLPLPILDIPQNTSPQALVRVLKALDCGGVDIVRNAQVDNEKRLRANKRASRNDVEARAKDIATFIRNNL